MIAVVHKFHNSQNKIKFQQYIVLDNTFINLLILLFNFKNNK